MVCRLGRAFAFLLLVGIGIGVSARAHACFICSPQFGCSSTPSGFLTCHAWYVFGMPLCFSSGNCAGWIFGSGDAPDAFPKVRRPIWNQTSAAIETEINVYTTITPCARGCGVLAPGQAARVLRTAAHISSPEAMISEVAKLAGVSTGDMPIHGTGVSVGMGRVESALAGRDGNGFAVRAVRRPEGVVFSVCSIEAGTLGQRLAFETLGVGDMLLVRTWIEEQECLVALSGALGATDRSDAAEVLKQRRASFLGRARWLTMRGRRPAFQLAQVELNGAGCR